MDKKYRYIKLFDSCRLVDGFRRSMIYDLDRRDFFYIPNALYEILHKNNGVLKDDLYCAFYDKDRSTVKKYITYLLDKHIVFYCNKCELSSFIKLSNKWEHSALITNAIIYLNENVSFLKNIIDELQILLCKDLLFIANEFKVKDLQLLSQLTLDCDVNSISLYLPYYKKISRKWLTSYLVKNKRIKRIVLYNSDETQNIFFNDIQLQEIIMVKHSLSSCFRCQKQEVDFDVNRSLYLESLHFNSCLNRKVSIDANGNIKNCPNTLLNYGNIKNTSIVDAVKDKKFSYLWHITKDKIDVCKDCEYRYVCEDCRYHIKDKDNIYSQPSKCNYNPYIAKWKDEDGYVPVEECGTYSRETGFIPDKRKIAKLNKLLWAE